MSDGWNGPVIQRGTMAADVVGRGFTQISNEVFRNPRITGTAKAVFAVIAGHRDGYGISVAAIAKHMYEGRDAIQAALRCLEKYGYLVRTQARNPDGTLGRSVYAITDMPDGLAIIESAPYPEQRFRRSEPVTDNPSPVVTCGNDPQETRFPRSEPVTDYPSTAQPSTAEPSHKNTSHKNTNLVEKTKNNSSSDPEQPPTARDGERGREEEGPSNQQTSQALTLVDRAAASWVRRPNAEERARLVGGVVQALAAGASSGAVMHGLTRDLETARNPVAVVTSRTRVHGWADHDPAAIAAEAAKPKLPPHCGDRRCRAGWFEDEEGNPIGRCASWPHQTTPTAG